MSWRTHLGGDLRAGDEGARVTLAGWVARRRDHGGLIFIDLRDQAGLVQLVFNPDEHEDAHAVAHTLRAEFVVQAEGVVRARSAETVNPRLASGRIEVHVERLEVLATAPVLPFQLDDEGVDETLRLRHRYLDLRRDEMRRNIHVRFKLTQIIRRFLEDRGFWELETPILYKSTPEGAREFLVPTSTHPGRFYALPQAPQQYKQLLMVAGLEKYFQIARCFRDEDLRADRQPEFTQIDIEASFVNQEDIIGLVEGLLASMFKAGLDLDVPRPFPRMTYREAEDMYGSDKPDTRYGMKIIDLGAVFEATEFKIFRSTLDGGGVVRAINAKGFAGVTTGQMNRLNEIAIQAGLPVKTLAFIKLENGEFKSPLWKFFTDAEKDALVKTLAIEEGDIVFFVAGKRESVSTILGRVRIEVADMMELTKNSTAYNFLWVVDFPLLALDAETGSWAAVHHPFTRPNAEDIGLLEEGKFEDVRAVAYDVVLNGYELGGGSIRIHEKDLQAKMFGVLGVGPEEQEEKFSHILDAFRFGAPPHGGLALGLDRIAMLAAGEDSIREVIAFPKNNKGSDLMAHSPCVVDFKSLREVYVQSTYKEKKD